MIDVQGIGLSYGERRLFQGLSFQLGDSEKVCLAGPNGSGKTTLLRLIFGELQPEEGTLVRTKGMRMGYLRQHLEVGQEATVYQAAFSAFDSALKAEAELESLQTLLLDRAHPPTPEELERMDFLHEELLRSDYYTAESRTRKILTGLGFSPEAQEELLSRFSGGWQMRVALARLLLTDPDCLLLDEPTNHLDIESIVWLEGYIESYRGALILISHDRLFVEKVCDHMIEIERGQLTSYPLPYARYEAERQLRREQLLREYKKQQDQIESLERFVERFKAKASKATQAQSKMKQLEKIERIEIPEDVSRIRLRFPEAPPSGEWIFTAEGLEKRYGELLVFAGGKVSIQKGQKVVFTGPNGAGKTTLLKILLGREKPTSGEIVTGHNVKIGYFAQYDEPDEAEKNTDLVSLLLADSPKSGMNQIRAILGAMLFSDDDAFKKYGVLSGGERARVRLCRLLLRECNVLVLDEPTNHLDVESKELLLKALSDFSGTVLLVSHDRYFVERIATRVVLVRDRKIVEYPGDYAYYLHKLKGDQAAAPPGAAGIKKAPAKGAASAPAKPPASAPAPKSASGPVPVSAPAPAPGPGPASPSPGTAPAGARHKEREKQRQRLGRKIKETETKITDTEAAVARLDEDLCRPEVFSSPALSLEKTAAKKAAEMDLMMLYRSLETLLEEEGALGA